MRSVIDISILLGLLFVSVNTHATNGYFTHGIGVRNKSLAGAGSATPNEAASSATNPAAAVLVGDRLEVGLSVFSPTRSYKASSSSRNGRDGVFSLQQTRNKSNNAFFPIPYIGKVWSYGEKSAFAINFYGRGGMNTEYRGSVATFDADGPGPAPVSMRPGTFGAGTTGVDLSQAFIDLSYARITGPVSWGVGLIVAAQSFEAKGLGNFAAFTESFARSGGSRQPNNLTDNGHEISFGYGVKVGAIWSVTDRLNLAASYQSEIVMQKFDEYSDLFAEDGGFDIPANARVGVSWEASGRLRLHVDVERTFFSDVSSVGNSISNLAACPTAGRGGQDFEACLGGDHGGGFGWDDVTIYHFGAELYLSATPRWSWRAGYSQTKQPIGQTESLFNILAPAVVEQHYTFGGSRALKSGKEVSFAVMYAPKNKARGVNTFDPSQIIELEMHQFEFELGFRF